ncbi:MAG TPA: hypothetical protein VGO22_07145 [Pseudorhizobium sp.]|nr:hypothetical protein [Pseudorhizobium sp.]
MKAVLMSALGNVAYGTWLGPSPQSLCVPQLRAEPQRGHHLSLLRMVLGLVDHLAAVRAPPTSNLTMPRKDQVADAL